MREKVVPAVFLMLVLLIGFPSSVGDFSAFGDKDDDKENKNLRVSAEDSKAYQKQKEKAEKAKQKAEERKEKLKEKYEKEIEELKEKAKKQEEKETKKYEQELKKLEEKAKRLDDYNGKDNIKEFGEGVYIDYSSKTTAVCHIPKGNPDNYHTIVVGTPAVRAHLAHGDDLGECGSDGDVVLEEYELKKAAKLAKLEEKRSELQQKFIDKAQKLKEKFEEKQNKRAEKLLEKVQSGEYYDEFIEDEGILRQFELTFASLTAEPIGQPSEPTEFSGSITLVTSSSTNSKGTMKFKVTECELGDESETSYTCEYGKARTTSKGTGGDKNGLVIIASLHDDNRGSVPGLKAFVTADLESLEQSALRQLEGGTYENILTMHSPQSKITHQWFLGSEENGGTLVVTEISPSITSITDYEADYDYANHEDDEEDEIEIKGIVGSVEDNALTLEDGTVVLVDDKTEFDEGFDLSNIEGHEVDIDAIEIDGNLVATEIEVEDDLDDDDLDDDEDEEDEDEEEDDDEDDDDDDEEDDD